MMPQLGQTPLQRVFGQQRLKVMMKIRITLTAKTNSGSTVKGHETPANPIEFFSFPSLRPEFIGILAV